MKEDRLLLSEFTNEEGFELNSYLTSLFEYFSNLTKTEGTKIEPAPWCEGVALFFTKACSSKIVHYAVKNDLHVKSQQINGEGVTDDTHDYKDWLQKSRLDLQIITIDIRRHPLQTKVNLP